MISVTNKYLIVRKNVILTEKTDRVIKQLDRFFEKANCRSYVTSGKRFPDEQLRIIKEESARQGIDKIFPEIKNSKIYGVMGWNPDEYEIEKLGCDKLKPLWGIMIAEWQRAWSLLLNGSASKQFIVAPVFSTVCLYDYFRPPDTTKNKIGERILESNHYSGNAFDIGGSGGNDSTIEDELKVIQEVIDKNLIPEIKSITIERGNNCIHVDC